MILGRWNRGKCNETLIRWMYDRLVIIPFEVHNSYNLDETTLFNYGKGDCEDKAPVLARFMIRNGCVGVKLLYMESVDVDEAGHVAVLFDGYVYDPTMDYYKDPAWNYKSKMASYKNFTSSSGVSTGTVKSAHKPFLGQTPIFITFPISIPES